MKKQFMFIVILATLLLAVQSACGSSDHLEYRIDVEEDCSALWTIIQATDINSAVDSWEEFEDRIFSTINAAIERTGRFMVIDTASLEMKTEIFWETSSKTIEYRFRWQNFSITEQGQKSFGDVFGEKFFALLYGDGELYVTYPTEYTLSSVSFRPNQEDDSTQTFHWYRTQDFSIGDQQIVLTAKASSPNAVFQLLTIATLGSAGLSILAVSFFIFKQRRQKMVKLNKFSSWQKIESDQDKILQLLWSSDRNMKQSEVGDKLRFSRAKTSLLLSEMEKNRLVKRYKKGKKKIVFPIENKKGQKL